MDNFEYSIQLNDREWAEFLSASEECALAPAALATAEEQCLSDIEQGDGVPGRDCTAGQLAERVGNKPGPGWGHSAPRGVATDTSLRWPGGGHLSPPELLSGSEDETDLGSVGRFLCDGDKPGCPALSPMPSAQRRQPSCPPAAARAGPAGTAPGSAGQDAPCEAAAAAEPGAAGGSQAMEPPSCTDGKRTPERGKDAGEEQPRGSPLLAQPPVPGSSPALARKNPSSASRPEPGIQGSPRDPSLETAARAREEASGDRAGTQPSSPAGSPDVVRPKVPGQPRKSRKQRGAAASEAAPGDREPAGAAAQGAGAPVKAPLSSPASSRKSKGKEKAARPALVKLGSEEGGEGKRPVPGPGTEEGDPAVSASPKQKVKELGTQPPGKATATKQSKPGQAGGLGVGDTVPVIPANGAVAPLGDACQEVLGKPLHPKSVVASGGDGAGGAHWEPVAKTPVELDPPGKACQEVLGKPLHPKSVVTSGRDGAGGAHGEPAAKTPVELGPPCCAAEAPARADTLDVTWPEMYEYLFCDSQGEEEGMEDSLEGNTTPLEREISLPELYEYFFNEPEGNRKKAKGKDRKRKKFSSLDQAWLENEDPDSAPIKDSLVISVPEVSKHFFQGGPENRAGWRGIFPIAPASEVKKAVGALKSLLQRPMQLVRGQAPAAQALVRRGSGEKLALVPLAPLGRGQEQPEGLDMALALTGTPEVPLALTHKDMCLVFCAFASWAVKTSDLQAPDAWKTMFLASFGTLSAIRYFRRQVREGHPRV
ncbi:PGC-1 and ERR-induced regulator in muscle protein 1 isoform X2 [Apus apus]|uniref:PGC-1 and ERR-induced regulator in muscle protein 1 isoform X2 n=1 Tax=Apus apus TaxID=8895 RepID=UPI0021F8771D|nr:PGC-1 and ERR-induced regulator in muscle protein 1 isoform X2 [Apus apus]